MYIKYKLGLSFGAMVGLILLFATLSWQNTQTLIKLETFHGHFLRARMALAEARRNEKNYFLRHERCFSENVDYWLDFLNRAIQEEQSRVTLDDVAFRREAKYLLQEYRRNFSQIVEKYDPTAKGKNISEEERVLPIARVLQTLIENQLSISEKNLEDQQRYITNFFIGFVLFSLLFSGCMVILFMRSILKSLRVGIHFAQEISSGNLNASVSDGLHDEIGILLSAMHKMAKDLQHMEEDTIRAQAGRIAISALLETSLEPLSLKRQLEVSLDIILSVAHLYLENKGAIFLVDDTQGLLHIVAFRGLDSEDRGNHSSIPLASCLCCNPDDDDKRPFLVDKGSCQSTCQEVATSNRYCVPILSRGKVLGVMTLYPNSNHQPSHEKESLLTIISFTLAGILERKRIEERIQHLAHYDQLTSLPNRSLFDEHFSQSLAMATRSESLLAVMLIDLDHFKQVNDTLGHAAGDEVLIAATQRIRKCLRASDLVARMGGDEFAIILSNLPLPEAAGLVAEKIVNSVCQPIDLSGKTVLIGASIGIAVFPTHGLKSDSLLTHADMAMYKIKRRGRNGYCYYDKNDEEQIETKVK